MTAAVLQISSGVGPSEARRFVVLLAARLEARAHDRGLEVAEVVSSGAAGAPRSIALHLRGDVAIRLADELGTHMLIDRSARRGRAARKRWFAAVTLHAAPPAALAVALPRDQLVITACRAGGPGGQHVNKVSSAVRVQHLPSGLAVRSAGERSQQANLDRALRRLAALLHQAAQAAVADARDARRRVHYQLERGAPIRTYTLGDDGALLQRRPP